MDKNQKIRILKAIQSGELEISALNLEPGIYRRTDRPGIYQNDAGFEIEYSELTRLSESLSFMVQASFVNDEEFPALIMITDFAKGWIEGKQYTEFHFTNLEAAENVVRLGE